MGWLSGFGETLKAIVSPIMKPINTWQERKNQKVAAEHALEMASLEFKTQLVMNRESHNQSWEIESLKQKPKTFMQWISFLVLGAPFIVAWFNPALVKTYFVVSLAVIPLWYQQMFIAIIGVIWGIAQLKNAAEGISNTIKSYKSQPDLSKMQSIESEKIIRAGEKFEVFNKKS